MKLFHTVTEVKLMQMDHDLKMRSAELDARAALQKAQLDNQAALQKKDVQLDGERSVQQTAYNAMQLRLETQNAQDKAQSVVENAKAIAELTEKLAVAQAEVKGLQEQVKGLQAFNKESNADRSALLFTVMELAKNPVIVEKLTQTSTAVPAQMCVIHGDKAVPVQIVK